MNRFEFVTLSLLERTSGRILTVRRLSEYLLISSKSIKKCLESLISSGSIRFIYGSWKVTEKGYEALERYRVQRAVILAAGFGSRMMPATVDKPKPMVTVKGIRILDTLLDALVSAGIEEITVVGGYKFEKLKELLIKYPFIKLMENKEYINTNNISSAVLASDTIRDGCYICEADLFISNPQIITKYQYSSNILGSYSLETDDWSFHMDDSGYLRDYKKGGTHCYNYYGISYWTPEDCEKLKKDFREVYESPGGKDYFWEFVPFVLRKENYKVEVRPCRKQDIIEIDNYSELAQLDSSYRLEGDTKQI